MNLSPGAEAAWMIAAGEAASAGPEDLVVERVDGRLRLTAGPRDILGPRPSALLAGAAATRPAVEAMLERVRRWEERA